MKRTNAVLLNSDSAAGLPSGQNGAGQTDPRAVLDAMVAQRDFPPAPESETPDPASAIDAPEEPPAPTQEDEPGQDILTSEETPVAEAEAETTGELENDGADEPPTEDGAVTKATQQRIDKLTAQKYAAQERAEQAEAKTKELEAQLQDVTSQREVTHPGASALPESVSKLKTVAEVQARLDTVQTDLDALTDFLDANPGDGEAKYQIGPKEFTRNELVARRAALRTEARVLPQRAQQITSTAQFSQQRKAESAKLLQARPELADEQHPLTKTWRQLTKLPQFQRETNGDELAYLLARGHAVVTAEAAAKGRTPQRGGPTGKPLGSKVALKPAANGASRTAQRSVPPVNGEVVVKALEGVRKVGSQNSLAQLLEATGR